ncbi:MAG: hypothetical protein ABEJ56_07095, partial [Candidatus Nanohaloarchaea archaeon]
LEVEDEVILSFSGDTEALEDQEQMIHERVNVKGIDFSGEDFEYSGEVEFRDRKIEFSFSEPVE